MLTFSWQVGAGPITNTDSAGAWSNFSALNFVSPNLSASSNALDGNAAINRQAFSSVVLPGVVVNPGQELFLRWQDVDDGGFDNALAIDDLTVTFDAVASVPEPQPGSSNTISLLTYNVGGNGATDWSTNATQVQAIGRILMYLNPDLITFNEIPHAYTNEMKNWITAFLPAYHLAISPGSDTYLHSTIASRFPITRFKSWLDGAQLEPWGYTNSNFTRDLFEAEVAVPGFTRPLHVFTVHLKASSGTNYADTVAKRAAEAAAITNFLATNLFVLYPLDPYTLSGDINEADKTTLALQRLLSPPPGLKLTTPKNPVTGSINTFSIQNSLSERIDYIFPNGLLYANIKTGLVFRTDRVSPLPPNLYSNDSRTASDHLPAMMVFNNPYDKPFRLTSITRSSPIVSLQWGSVFGQPYRVEASSNLTAWGILASNLVATGTNFNFVTNVPEAVKYFRVYRVP